MTLIKKVAELKELELQCRGDPDSYFKCDLRNGLHDATPTMLDVLGGFREGDAKLLERVAYEEEQMAKFVAGFGKPDRHISDMIRRYQAMAAKMEATE